MLYFRDLKMKCWICGQEGNTGEHLIKESDLRSYFGDISQKCPIFFHTKDKRNIPVGSLKSKRFKSDALICNRCNSALTQPYDRAWETLSIYLRSEEYGPTQFTYIHEKLWNIINTRLKISIMLISFLSTM